MMISSNYAGRCQHEPLTNDHILQINALTTSNRYEPTELNGSTLFALKYRVIPCKLERCCNKETDSTDQYNKPQMHYHAARSVKRFLFILQIND